MRKLMRRKIQLPKDFYEHDFEEMSRSEPHPRTRIRFIGMSHIQKGRSYEYVAQSLLKSTSSIKKWVKRYRDNGIDGLREGQRSGRTRKDADCEADLLSAILELQEKKDGGRVRLQDIRSMLLDDFGIKYEGVSGVHYLLGRLGCSWISSRSRHPKSDHEAMELYKKNFVKP